MEKYFIKNINKILLLFSIVLCINFAQNTLNAVNVDAFCTDDEKCTDITYITLANPSTRSESYYNGNKTYFLYNTNINTSNYEEFYNRTDKYFKINNKYNTSFESTDHFDDGNMDIETTSRTATFTDTLRFLNLSGDWKNYDKVITRSNNYVFYNALPENALYIHGDHTTNGVTYALKIAKKAGASGVEYTGIFRNPERAYKIDGNGDYVAFNELSQSAVNHIKDNYLFENSDGSHSYHAYISKVLAIRKSNGNFLLNIDNETKAHEATSTYWGATSTAFDQLFDVYFRFNIPVKPIVIVINKYKDEETGKFTVTDVKPKIQSFELNTEVSKTMSNAKSSEGYNYIGYKYVSSDKALTEDISEQTLASFSNLKSGGYLDNTVSFKVKKKYNVVVFYYAKRQVEINHILLDQANNVVKKIKTDNNGNVIKDSKTINIPQTADYQINYLGATYTNNGKVYKYVTGKKWVGDTLTFANLKRDTNGATSDWGSNLTYTKLFAKNYVGTGHNFMESNSVAVNFYYQEDNVELQEKRKVYIRNVDTNGNVIGFNSSEKINGISRPNGYDNTALTTSEANKSPEYSNMENYIIRFEDTMTIKNKSIAGYTYSGYKKGDGGSKPIAESNRDSVANLTTSSSISLLAKSINYTCIDFVYEPTTPPPVTETIDLTGKLDFINNPLDSGSSAYASSTSGEDTDYIASSKALKAYIARAYPYYFRRVDYGTEVNNGVATATITVTASGSGSGTHCVDPPPKPAPKLPSFGSGIFGIGAAIAAAIAAATSTETQEKICTPFSASASASTTFTYTVNYSHSYYHITNFKMYRISKVSLYDWSSNPGGTLFGDSDDTYTLDTSQTYNNRFLNGYNLDHTSVSFPSSSYSAGSVTGYDCGDDTSCSGLQDDVDAIVDPVTQSDAALHEKLQFTIDAKNEDFGLSGRSKLLNPNKKTMTYDITSASNTVNIDTRDAQYVINKEQYQASSSNADTNMSDFVDNPILTIPITQVNGLRESKAKIYYTIDNVTDYTTSGISTNYDGSTDYSDQSHDYTGSDVNKVNVLTPLNASVSIKTDEVVNHSNSSDNVTLQKNSTFTITPSVHNSSVKEYINVDTNQFLKYYYVKCDFDITNLQVYGNRTEDQGYDTYSQEEIIKSGTWIKVPAGGYLTAKATQYTETEGTTVNRFTNNVYAVAIAKNVPEILEQEIYNSLDTTGGSSSVFNNYIDNGETVPYEGPLRQINYYTMKSIVSDAYHMVKTSISTSNLGRIFDFKLTDCSDLNFKDVFRTSTATNVNTPTGTTYFSGVRRLKMYDTSSEIGYNETEEVSNKKTTLPLGPYKNTNVSKIEAPKLGYRISFDLKTTGYITDTSINAKERYVKIIPTYYYISKDGTEYDPNITLYYKNSSGKYVAFVNSGYKIYFKPNDGYRNLSNASITPNSSFLSTKLEELDISSSSGFTLTSQMMDTSGNGDNFIQAWYGEYKLPNSTIAISSGGNLNNPKTDGYIGVKFKIDCYDIINGKTVIVSYNQDDKSATSTTNTSQWDYDGYLGFTSPGQAASNLKLLLEKGTKALDNTMYNNIKSTVILYDTDNRAAEDFG